MKKNKVINTAVCDAREVTEDSLANFETVTINAAILLVGKRSKELLNKYPVTLNVASVQEVPDDENIHVKVVNGKLEIGPDAEGEDTFLVVNGKVTVLEDSLEALKSYYTIVVNGSVLMPESYKGKVQQIQVNGDTKYYPDGAMIIKADQQIDPLFVLRAQNHLYYCPGDLFFLDLDLDTDEIIEKNMKFVAKRVIIAKSLLKKLLSLFDENTEIIQVPDGTRMIEDDLELKMKTIKRYGSKLYVGGDVKIQDSDALAALDYLYADGSVYLNKDLEEAFDQIEAVYDKLTIIDPELGFIADHVLLKLGPTTLSQYPKGLRVEDCAKLVLSEDLTPEEIMKKLHISDCALVICTKEQEEAVHMVSEDVAMVEVSDQEEGEKGELGKLIDTMLHAQVINASEYKM